MDFFNFEQPNFHRSLYFDMVNDLQWHTAYLLQKKEAFQVDDCFVSSKHLNEVNLVTRVNEFAFSSFHLQKLLPKLLSYTINADAFKDDCNW